MKPIEINLKNHDIEIKQSDTPVLMVFSATWCPTCRMFAPVMNQLATDITHTKIAAINIDDNKELTEQYGIEAIPTIVYIKDGKITTLPPGYKKKEELLELIEK